MSRATNLAGARFGKLTAIEPTPERMNGYTVWRCRCDCGNEILVSSRILKKGWTTSCGCEEKKPRTEDLTGRRFGMLTVLSRADYKSENGQILWNCACDCGGKIVAPTGQLNAGYRKSCGCLSRPPLKDWVGRTFGSLTVLSYDGKRGGKHYWKCRCNCGNEISVCQSSLKNGHTTSCGCQNIPYAAKHFVDGTCIEAIRSKTVAKNNSSGVRGVYKNKRTGRWCAQITFQGRTRYLGSYDTLAEATIARQKGEEIYDDFLASYEARCDRGTGTVSHESADTFAVRIRPGADACADRTNLLTHTAGSLPRETSETDLPAIGALNQPTHTKRTPHTTRKEPANKTQHKTPKQTKQAKSAGHQDKTFVPA